MTEKQLKKQLTEMLNNKIKQDRKIEDLELYKWRAENLRESIINLRDEIEAMGNKKTKKDIIEHINNILIYY